MQNKFLNGDKRDMTDVAQASFLHDYDFAMQKGANAMVVAREMLLYCKPVTSVPAELIAREELLRKLVAENPYVKAVSDKGEKSEKKKKGR